MFHPLPLLAELHHPAIDAISSFAPVVLLLLILFFLFRKQAKLMKRQGNDAERREQHMRRVEELLDRIANAIERRQ